MAITPLDRCPECGAEVSSHANFCQECGFTLKERQREYIRQEPAIDEYSGYSEQIITLWKPFRQGFRSDQILDWKRTDADAHGNTQKMEFVDRYVLEWKPGKWMTARGRDIVNTFICAYKNIIDGMRYFNAEIIAQVEVKGKFQGNHWESMRIVDYWMWTDADNLALFIFATGLLIQELEAQIPEEKQIRAAYSVIVQFLENKNPTIREISTFRKIVKSISQLRKNSRRPIIGITVETVWMLAIIVILEKKQGKPLSVFERKFTADYRRDGFSVRFQAPIICECAAVWNRGGIDGDNGKRIRKRIMKQCHEFVIDRVRRAGIKNGGNKELPIYSKAQGH